jgi:hypothetical protein
VKEGEDRLTALRRRASWEREDLATALSELQVAAGAFREKWRFAGWAATGLAAAATAGWRLFGRHSLAAKAGRVASAASLLFGIGRGLWRIRRLW